MKKVLPSIAIIGAVTVAISAANWPAVRLARIDPADLMSRLGALLLFALLIECMSVSYHG